MVPMTNRFPFYTKLAITTSLIGILVTGTFFFLAMWSSEKYHQEVTQKLHRGLAHYVLDHLAEPLFFEANDSQQQGLQVNKKVLKGIAMNTMMINPSVEVYLIDNEGHILGHALPEASVDSGRVRIEAIESWLSGERGEAILGDNPRQPGEQNIFSVSPVYYGNLQQGYLYIVLASHESSSIAESVMSSHVSRVLLIALIALLIFFSLSAWLAFRKISRPLKELDKEVSRYRESELEDSDVSVKEPVNDEIESLSRSFKVMRERIQSQFDLLAENDRLRRELVSNVSHDLRTPLAAMQGYLETLLIKSDSLETQTQQQYLEVAHRQSRHLGELVSQLFELSKLEAGKVTPDYECFSLTELIYDVLQDYELKAQEEGIGLTAKVPDKNIVVKADISLMQRVLRNLIDNAFAHSHDSGAITLSMLIHEEKVVVGVGDRGEGIAEEDLPYVFDRFYQSGAQTSKGEKKAGAGLGLSIVKKILDLHDSVIRVRSEQQVGTEFSFELNREFSAQTN